MMMTANALAPSLVACVIAVGCSTSEDSPLPEGAIVRQAAYQLVAVIEAHYRSHGCLPTDSRGSIYALNSLQDALTADALPTADHVHAEGSDEADKGRVEGWEYVNAPYCDEYPSRCILLIFHDPKDPRRYVVLGDYAVRPVGLTSDHALGMWIASDWTLHESRDEMQEWEAIYDK